MLERPRYFTKVQELLAEYPVVAILGPRQIGKTTLARQLAERFDGPVTFFDLEDPADLARLNEPRLVLEPLSGLVVIDEIQLKSELFPLLRVLADRPGVDAHFLLLGSASLELVNRSSETLAGRIAFVHLEGFRLDEVGPAAWRDLLSRGSFPRSFLALSDAASLEWRQFFIDTFLTRDLPMLGSQVSPATLRRFWTLLAHYHGQLWEAAELGRVMSISATTVRRYLDLLTSVFLVRQLPPFFENIGKRQVKSPKIYFADSGLLLALLGVESFHDLLAHPKIGAVWEGFAIGEILSKLEARESESSFWATHGGAEIDLVAIRGQRRRGFELKFTDAPKVTKSMLIALEDLRLDRIDVVHAGRHSFPMRERIWAISIEKLREDLPPL
jgi:uncharacterized protein